MKKLIVLLLVSLMAISLFAGGASETSSQGSSSTDISKLKISDEGSRQRHGFLDSCWLRPSVHCYPDHAHCSA